MFAIILIGAIAAIFWKTLQGHTFQATALGSALEHVIKSRRSIVGTGSTTKPDARSKEMSVLTDEPWLDWDPEEFQIKLSGTMIRQSGIASRCFGPLRMEVLGDEILIFDWMFTLAHKDINTFGGAHFENHARFYQTVVVIDPVDIDIPTFYLRPHNYVIDSCLSRYPKVDTKTSIDGNYIVETMVGYRVEAMFQSQFGIGVLIPFLEDKKWTIEWNGNVLTVHTLDRIVAPEDIKAFALEVTELMELLRSGKAAVDHAMRQKVELALAEMNQSLSPV